MLTVGFNKTINCLSQQSHKPVPGKKTGEQKEERNLSLVDGNTKNCTSEETSRELLLKQLFAMNRPLTPIKRKVATTLQNFQRSLHICDLIYSTSEFHLPSKERLFLSKGVKQKVPTGNHKVALSQAHFSTHKGKTSDSSE